MGRRLCILSSLVFLEQICITLQVYLKDQSHNVIKALLFGASQTRRDEMRWDEMSCPPYNSAHALSVPADPCVGELSVSCASKFKTSHLTAKLAIACVLMTGPEYRLVQQAKNERISSFTHSSYVSPYEAIPIRGKSFPSSLRRLLYT